LLARDRQLVALETEVDRLLIPKMHLTPQFSRERRAFEITTEEPEHLGRLRAGAHQMFASAELGGPSALKLDRPIATLLNGAKAGN
jgi:hypothetical protein